MNTKFYHMNGLVHGMKTGNLKMMLDHFPEEGLGTGNCWSREGKCYILGSMISILVTISAFIVL